jgi:predicted phosphate transport protein (TIGR00153 family)
MLGWFQAIMPKEERFFTLFEQHARVVVAGAEALRGLLKGGDTVDHYCKEIMARENDADEITREVLTAVRRTFITPFDRSDIQHLIGSMDDAIDQMNKTAKLTLLLEVKSFEPHMRDMGEIIVQASNLVLKVVPLLNNVGRNATEINAITSEIISIEEKADGLHDAGRKALFLANRNGSAGNAMNFIIGADMYDHLEKVVDRFEDVANEISAIVTDHL